MPARVGDRKFGVLNEYIKHIRTFKFNKIIRNGFLYTYKYLFIKNPTFRSQPFSKVKFYDFWPATFVFEVKPKTKTFFGINFHHMPVRARKIWLFRISKAKQKPERIRILYSRLKRLDKKSTFAVRQYRMDRGFEYRRIPFADWNFLFNFYARTYFGTTVDNVAARYRRFRPKF